MVFSVGLFDCARTEARGCPIDSPNTEGDGCNRGRTLIGALLAVWLSKHGRVFDCRPRSTVCCPFCLDNDSLLQPGAAFGSNQTNSTPLARRCSQHADLPGLATLLAPVFKKSEGAV